ncbi:hypothetical protein ACHQM5_011314 [Ranunculus cassubicifolius]
MQEIQSTIIAFQNFGKLTDTENSTGIKRKWEDMEFDVLVRIFLSFNIVEIASTVSRVCRSWRLACCDPLLWKTTDFTVIQSNYIKIPAPPYVWVADAFDKEFMKTIMIVMGLSSGNAKRLVFHFDLYLKDEQLIYVSERSPHLKELVLPAWNRITKGGICKAIRNWGELESLVMPSIRDPAYILEEISLNCKNFTQLKVMGTLDIMFATKIIKYVPKLKRLSLRCCKLNKDALIMIMENLECLEILNISHCLFVNERPFPGGKQLLRKVDTDVFVIAARLHNFYTCQDKLCVVCSQMMTDEGCLRWYRCEEGEWRKDEICSFSY